MRTPEEIVEKASDEDDVLGFAASTLIPFLPFAQAKPFLKDEVTEADWQPTPYTRDVIIQEMREYMEFGWEKALDERGISASRTISRYQAWVWLLGDEDMYRFLKDDGNYPMYGKPLLRKLCETYGFPIPLEAGGPDQDRR